MNRRPEPELMTAPESRAYARADFSSVNAAFLRRLLALAGAIRRARALDLGTGPGDIPRRLAAARRGWEITALDASPEMIRIARRALRQTSVRVVRGDAKSSPLAAGAFDLIFANSILHHVRSPRAFWSEVRRLAAPGALVFVRDLFRPPSPGRARQIVAAYAGTESATLQREFFESLLSSYTVPEVRHQLRRAGLALRARRSSDRHLDIWGRLP